MTGYRGLFITGTDTGIGKTVITAALTAWLRGQGSHVGIWKPVQSGEKLGRGASDAERLLRYTGLRDKPEEAAPYSFEAPLCPYLAAKQEGTELTLEALEASGQPLMARYDALLVEGPGGAAVPLTADALVADWIARLGLPALIVARSGLGTINHTLLTVAFLRERGVTIAGVILNGHGAGSSSTDPSVGSNAEMIERFGGVKVLGTFPSLAEEGDWASLALACEKGLDMASISSALSKKPSTGG